MPLGTPSVTVVASPSGSDRPMLPDRRAFRWSCRGAGRIRIAAGQAFFGHIGRAAVNNRRLIEVGDDDRQRRGVDVAVAVGQRVGEHVLDVVRSTCIAHVGVTALRIDGQCAVLRRGRRDCRRCRSSESEPSAPETAVSVALSAPTVSLPGRRWSCPTPVMTLPVAVMFVRVQACRCRQARSARRRRC